MKRIDIYDRLETEFNFSRVKARGVVNSVIAVIAEGLAVDGEVHLREFGTLRARPIPARQARNPKTVQAITLPPAIRVTFSCSSKLRDELTARRLGEQP